VALDDEGRVGVAREQGLGDLAELDLGRRQQGELVAGEQHAAAERDDRAALLLLDGGEAREVGGGLGGPLLGLGAAQRSASNSFVVAAPAAFWALRASWLEASAAFVRAASWSSRRSVS
jgi:hypothetical protein